MRENVHCPMCDDGVAVPGEGRLEQSGDTYLPTTVWACRRCGYVRYEAALGARWRAETPEPAPPVRRAA